MIHTYRKTQQTSSQIIWIWFKCEGWNTHPHIWILNSSKDSLHFRMVIHLICLLDVSNWLVFHNLYYIELHICRLYMDFTLDSIYIYIYHYKIYRSLDQWSNPQIPNETPPEIPWPGSERVWSPPSLVPNGATLGDLSSNHLGCGCGKSLVDCSLGWNGSIWVNDL